MDCIDEGASTLCGNPREGIDLGACDPENPVADTTAQRRVGQGHTQPVEDTRRFVIEPQPGRDALIAAQGRSYQSVPARLDTPLPAER